MNARPTDLELSETQQAIGLPSVQTVEKDWFVVQAIRAVLAVDPGPYRLVFAGGTSLARAHRLVERMSEDVDFKLVPGPDVPASKSAERRALSALRKRIGQALEEAGFSISSCRALDENRYLTYDLAFGRSHEQASNDGSEPLRPTIQVELNRTRLRTPAIEKTVASFVAQAYRRAPEVERIACTSLLETAAEKWVALTRRKALELSGAARATDPTLIRHLYDLHRLVDVIDLAALPTLVADIVKQDQTEFGTQHPAYVTDAAGETRKALEHLANHNEPRQQYKRFVAAMVYGPELGYEAALAATLAIAGRVWSETIRAA